MVASSISMSHSTALGLHNQRLTRCVLYRVSSSMFMLVLWLSMYLYAQVRGLNWMCRCVCGSVVFQLSDATDNSSSLENYESI